MIEIAWLGHHHAAALGVHLLALNDDDRYARFGHRLNDAAVLRWVRRIDWQRDGWLGAWWAAEDALVGVLQLAPLSTEMANAGTVEVAITVLPLLRRQGLATRLLATALVDERLAHCRLLLCHHGHPAVFALANRLGMCAQVDATAATVYLSGWSRQALIDVLASMAMGGPTIRAPRRAARHHG